VAWCAVVFGAPQRVAGVRGASSIPPLTRFRRARQRLTQRRAPVALARFRTAAHWLGAQSCSARRSAWQACAAPRRSTSNALTTRASAADTAACAGCFGPFPHGGTVARCAVVFGAPQRVAGVRCTSAIPPLTRLVFGAPQRVAGVRCTSAIHV
jgi:hypothetical protein